jgi:putative membrane protein
MRFVVWLAVNALSLAAAVELVDGVVLRASDDTRYVVELVVTGAVLGVVNAVVRPTVRLLALPLVLATLGLFLLVINAVMLLLVGAVAGALGLGLEVEGFWPALWGSVVISVCLLLLSALLPSRRRR